MKCGIQIGLCIRLNHFQYTTTWKDDVAGQQSLNELSPALSPLINAILCHRHRFRQRGSIKTMPIENIWNSSFSLAFIQSSWKAIKAYNLKGAIKMFDQFEIIARAPLSQFWIVQSHMAIISCASSLSMHCEYVRNVFQKKVGDDSIKFSKKNVFVFICLMDNLHFPKKNLLHVEHSCNTNIWKIDAKNRSINTLLQFKSAY